jgi:hypothetical protein
MSRLGCNTENAGIAGNERERRWWGEAPERPTAMIGENRRLDAAPVIRPESAPTCPTKLSLVRSPSSVEPAKSEPSFDVPCFTANRTIEQRLGALSGPTSRLSVEPFKTLVICLGLSGASPHQYYSRR